MKQTAVEWLLEGILNYQIKEGVIPQNIIEQAKEMEKQQQGYSEEEVLDILNNLRLDSYNYGMGRIELLEWFEQFKKK